MIQSLAILPEASAIQVKALGRCVRYPHAKYLHTYVATKAATRSYARTWAAEFKGRGIRVNTLSPGVTDTPILDSQSETEGRDEVVKMYLNMIPIGRLAEAVEIANATVFLGSDQSSYI